MSLINRSLLLVALLGFTTCVEDEKSITVIYEMGFAQAETFITENSTSTSVGINISPPLNRSADLRLAVESEGSGSSERPFTTAPPVVDNMVPLTVPAGSSFVSFAFSPIDNSLINEPRTVTFTIREAISGYELTQPQIKLQLLDNDATENGFVSISNFKTFFSTSDSLPGWKIKGQVVLSTEQENLPENQLILQDQSAGVLIEFDQSHGFAQDSTLIIDSEGASLVKDEETSLVLKAIFPLKNAEMASEPLSVVPDSLQLDSLKLKAAQYLHQLVSIKEVRFALSTAQLFGQNEGRHFLVDEGLVDSLLLRTEPQSPISNQNMPNLKGNLTGVLNYSEQNGFFIKLRNAGEANLTEPFSLHEERFEGCSISENQEEADGIGEEWLNLGELPWFCEINEDSTNRFVKRFFTCNSLNCRGEVFKGYLISPPIGLASTYNERVSLSMSVKRGAGVFESSDLNLKLFYLTGFDPEIGIVEEALIPIPFTAHPTPENLNSTITNSTPPGEFVTTEVPMGNPQEDQVRIVLQYNTNNEGQGYAIFIDDFKVIVK